jgi:hypothetical protein
VASIQHRRNGRHHVTAIFKNMKKVLLMICIAVQVASCRGQHHPQQQHPAGFHATGDHSSRQYYTVRHFFRQFDFNLSSIYGDMFINKAWH